MTDPIFSDNSLSSVKTALDGLAQRQQVIGNNLVNVDTPGYKAQSVSFEDTLQRELQGSPQISLVSTRQGHITRTSSQAGIMLELRQGSSTRADGNNVDIDVELNEMAKTGIEYQALTQLASKKLLLLKSIVTGR